LGTETKYCSVGNEPCGHHDLRYRDAIKTGFHGKSGGVGTNLVQQARLIAGTPQVGRLVSGL
jgi:hypothetical protein